MKQWLYNTIIDDPYMILIIGIIILLILCALGAWICDYIEKKIDKN